MSEEEPSLSNSLQKLEIEPSAKKMKPTPEEVNPFRRKRSKSLSSVNIFGSTCSCSKRQPFRLKNTTSFKRTTANRKILRDPVLKLVRCTKCTTDSKGESQTVQCKGRKCSKLFGGDSDNPEDFRSIVDACNQLSLANANDGVQDYSLPSFRGVRAVQRSDPRSDSSSVNSSCSHQARMSGSPPCDVTIDELASYFETFVHIPKKMSSMAEMMYI